MDEEIIQKLHTFKESLIEGIEIINSDISRLSLTRDLSIRDSVNNILVLFNGSLERIDSLIDNNKILMMMIKCIFYLL